MCLTVERAHLRQLRADVTKAIEQLREATPKRSKDFLLQLPKSIAEPAIIFRDFPKAHGNIIQKAVGFALSGHVGGYTQTAKKFTFLSGLSVEVDNFFIDASGRIYLFETKRDYSNVREDGVAARSLYAVKHEIEQAVRDRTGRSLRYPVEVSYFSYVDEAFKRPKIREGINVGTASAPILVTMPVYARNDMNRLIGICFGSYLELVDDLIGRTVVEAVPNLAVQPDRTVGKNPLAQAWWDDGEGEIVNGDTAAKSPTSDRWENGEETIVIGDGAVRSPTVDQILSE